MRKIGQKKNGERQDNWLKTIFSPRKHMKYLNFVKSAASPVLFPPFESIDSHSLLSVMKESGTVSTHICLCRIFK